MQNRKFCSLLLCVCLTFSFIACAEKPVSVFAAASLEPVLTQIFANYTQKTGINIEANYAASGQLIMQLENGAKANIFISAGGKQAQRAKDLNLVQESWPLLKNTLVIVYKNGKYEKIADVLNAKTIAMGETKTVPAGQYAKEALQNADIYEKASEKGVFLANVREVLTAVKSGNADVGFVYNTDALDSTLEYLQLPQELYSAINYPLVLLNEKENNKEAKKLADYLFSQEAKAVYSEKGFTFVERIN